jgi:hypothetical protein
MDQPLESFDFGEDRQSSLAAPTGQLSAWAGDRRLLELQRP